MDSDENTDQDKAGNYTYILECADGSLYTGWTNHLKERVLTHNRGKGAKYTRTRRPVTLVYYEEFSTKEAAMSREWQIKQLSRAQKLKLIHQEEKKIELISQEV